MIPPRANKQSLGNVFGQYFDAADPFGNAVDETSTKRLWAARYTWVTDEDGLPILRTVAGTTGPFGGLFPWTPKAPRKLGQWSWCFLAKITTASPLKATPIKTGTSSGWTPATDFEELEVFTSDGSNPGVGAFGLVAIGTDLGGQVPLFFQGGGAGDSAYRISVNNNDGTYVLTQYDYPGGTAGTGGIAAKEYNLAKNVPVNNYVKGSVKSDGNVWFNAPYGC